MARTTDEALFVANEKKDEVENGDIDAGTESPVVVEEIAIGVPDSDGA